MKQILEADNLIFEINKFLDQTGADEFELEFDEDILKIEPIRKKERIKNFLDELPKYHLGTIKGSLSREEIYNSNGR